MVAAQTQTPRTFHGPFTDRTPAFVVFAFNLHVGGSARCAISSEPRDSRTRAFKGSEGVGLSSQPEIISDAPSNFCSEPRRTALEFPIRKCVGRGSRGRGPACGGTSRRSLQGSVVFFPLQPSHAIQRPERRRPQDKTNAHFSSRVFSLGSPLPLPPLTPPI